ncbi:MAG: PP2C family protein-serine/threonine phosphatase [Planctomycetota bacterium]|jgi:serine phosphatase RsbU (regulator of sigma subunit)
MALKNIESKAFQQAQLRSERIRIIGLLLVFGAMLVVVVIRAILGSQGESGLLIPATVLIGSFAAYELFMLARVTRAIRDESDLPNVAWIINIGLETLLPTAAIVVLTETTFYGPFRALVAPALCTYYFFIILSTLRLSTSLCRLTGIFSTAGYLGNVAYTFWRYAPEDYGDLVLPLSVYLSHAVVILLAGFVAGAVAGQIRNHVDAALREAETRRKMDRIQHDLGIARSIQQGLLPDEPPKVDGFEIAGWSQPADETGGDYYDWQELPDKRVAISLADVTGHGIGPALVTAVCRAYARASFPSREAMAELVNRINELLVEDLVAGRFITFVVAFLDPKDFSLELLSAGHGPLLLYTAGDGKVQEFAAHDIPFGLASGVGYGPPQRIEFAPGDMLVLITDGFFEWSNADGEQYGTTRLGEVIRAHAHLAPDEIISRIYNGVREFTGETPQDDDLTAVVLKRNA